MTSAVVKLTRNPFWGTGKREISSIWSSEEYEVRQKCLMEELTNSGRMMRDSPDREREKAIQAKGIAWTKATPMKSFPVCFAVSHCAFC